MYAALEDAGADYSEVARRGNGMNAMMKMMEATGTPPFAPPFLKAARHRYSISRPYGNGRNSPSEWF